MTDHTLTLSPEAAARIAQLTNDAHERINANVDRVIAEGITPNSVLECTKFEVDTWQNLARTLAALIGLGGRVHLEDPRNFYGVGEFIHYGVNQSSTNGTWSINS